MGIDASAIAEFRTSSSDKVPTELIAWLRRDHPFPYQPVPSLGYSKPDQVALFRIEGPESCCVRQIRWVHTLRCIPWLSIEHLQYDPGQFFGL